MKIYSRFILVSLLLLHSSMLLADWMNLTGAETAENIAEIYVLDDHIKVKLEVYIGDLDKFEELLPDELIKNQNTKRPSLKQRMQNFANKRLQFVTEKGKNLPAQFVLVEPRERINRKSPYAGMINPTTRQRVKDAPTDKRVLYAEIIYPFSENGHNIKPEQLKIIPPQDEKGMVTANIGFLAYHQAVPIVDFRYLGQTVTLNLDWKDPWYTKFKNKNLSRHHKYPLMLYLYVEPRRVRFESLLRISDMTELTGFTVNNISTDVVDKPLQLNQHINRYYMNKKTLQIDGVSLKPDVIRIEFLHASLAGLKVVENISNIDEASLLVGVSQQYFIKALPQKINSTWTYFNQRIDQVPVIVTDPVGPLQTLIDKDAPEFGWENFLKKYNEPVIQPVIVETGLHIDIPYVGRKKIFDEPPDKEQALSIVGGVLENVRIAFFAKDPANFSKELDKIISTDRAKSLQIELAKLFSPELIGGSVGAIRDFNDVQIVNIQNLEKTNGFSAIINVSANISAKHWGHIDQRQIDSQMLLDLIEENKDWRLADLTVIDIKEAN